MKFGVIVFPGSNCDRDTVYVLENILQQETRVIWHKEKDLKGFDAGDCLILPGGFSYGDYLRSGAIARFSPIMSAVTDFANSGGYVFGICNGFQVLCESGLLPGALLRNSSQKFVSKNVYIKPMEFNSPITYQLNSETVLKIPIAHAEGRYFADPAVLGVMEEKGQILFKYCDEQGNITEEANANGSLMNIAGISNASKNVFGLMPHPERASDNKLGNTDGLKIFHSIMSYVKNHQPEPIEV